MKKKKKYLIIWTTICLVVMVIMVFQSYFGTADYWTSRGDYGMVTSMETHKILYVIDYDGIISSVVLMGFVWAVPLIIIILVKKALG